MRIFFTALFCFLLLNSFAQEVKIPINYTFKTVDDYKPYEDSVRIAAEWMINSPIDQDANTRDLAGKFLFRWVSGAPTTHIKIRGEFANKVIESTSNKYSNDLLMNYIAGMTLYKLNNPDGEDIQTQVEGVKAMLKGYESAKSYGKIKYLDKLAKVNSKGELESWIRDNIKGYDKKDKTKIIPKD